MDAVRSHVGRSGVALAVAVAVCFGLASPVATPGAHRSAVQVETHSAADLAAVLAIADDVWTDDAEPGSPVVVVLAPAALASLRTRGAEHRILVEDIDAVAVTERARLSRRVRGASAPDWYGEYRDLDEVNARMLRIAAQHPDLVRLQTLGASLEGRPIRALEITHGGTLGIAVDGGHHAREWISVMVPICIADRLVDGYSRDPRIRKVLESVRFYIAPVINPDGYRYSWDVNRYWRKNRRGGHGVDLGRNYSVGWGGAGSSTDRRSPNYRGEAPFSEPETRAMRALFERESIAAHVDFHSFSQVIVYPWSHQRAHPPDRAKFAAIADRMSTAIGGAHGERYAVRPGSKLRVGAGGTAGDWSYGTHGALSFLVELRPASRGDGGFVLPPDQIAPTCDEGLAGALALAEWMTSHR